MNIYIMIAILIANIVAIGIVHQFIKKLNKKEKILFIAVCVAAVYIAISITYWFSGFGINETVHEESKSFITYMFVPVNVILFVPYIASKYMKLKNKKIKQEEFIKKCGIVLLVAIIVLIGEYFYFRNMQQNIIQISDDAKETNQSIENENVQNELTQNEVVQNGVTENISVNEQEEQISNKIVNEQIN